MVIRAGAANTAQIDTHLRATGHHLAVTAARDRDQNLTIFSTIYPVSVSISPASDARDGDIRTKMDLWCCTIADTVYHLFKKEMIP